MMTEEIDKLADASDISRGFTVVPVLSFLTGHRLDDVVGAYVSGLRPSAVRISHGEIKLDARLWRVTIYVNEADFVMGIEQEVEVLLPEGCENGGDLDDRVGNPSCVDWDALNNE
jgi:hypothetical protein